MCLHAVDAAFECVAARVRRPDRLRVYDGTARRGEARVDGAFVDAGAAVLRDGADDDEFVDWGTVETRSDGARSR